MIFLLKYPKRNSFIEKHKDDCQKKRSSFRVCRCEWIFVLNFLKKKLPFLKSVSTHYEKSIIQAISFLGMNINGCYVRYQQNIKRHMQCTENLPCIAKFCRLICLSAKSKDKIRRILEVENLASADQELLRYVQKHFF